MMLSFGTVKEGDKTHLGNLSSPQEHAVGTTVAQTPGPSCSGCGLGRANRSLTEDSADSEAEPRPAGSESAF